MPDISFAAHDQQTLPLTIDHVISGIAREAAGPSYSVPALVSHQGQAGHKVALHSLGEPVFQSSAHWNDLRYARDHAGFPALQKLGKSRALYAALKAANGDVIHAHGLWQMPFIYAARVAKQTGKPLVLAPRGMLATAAMQVSARRKSIFALAAQNAALRQVSMFHATAVSEYDAIRNYGLTQPVAIVPNGIDVPSQHNSDRGTQNRKVLYLGRIHPLKGLDILIKSWAQIEKKHPEWHLECVGPDQLGYAAELRRLADELNLRHVTISPPVFGAEKWAAYAKADLYVLPSHSENFAITIAEALAASLPVISSKGAPWSGVETNACGWWVDLGVAEFATTLDTAMRLDDAQRQAMGARGRAWMIRDFSWPTIAQDMIAAYRWLLQAGPMPPHVRLD